MKKRSRPKRRVRSKRGDIVAIPLGDNEFAYGRLWRDCGVQVFDFISTDGKHPTNFDSLATKFFGSAMTKKIETGKWPIVGHLPFDNPEEAWTPPTFIHDLLDPRRYKIYERGSIRPASKQEIAGLEEEKLYFPDAFVDEIRRRFGK